MSQQKFIVGIGSSAGGLEALQEFFNATPHDNATYIVQRHLPMDYQTALIEIMKHYSKLEFMEAHDGMMIEKDKVYFPPAPMYMTTKDNRLFLQQRSLENRHPNRAVDKFLLCLAADKGGNGIGVILSGSGSDGTVGVSAIKEAGGMTIAQSPGSCDFPSMPQNAIATGNIDYVLPPGEMPEYIINYVDARIASMCVR